MKNVKITPVFGPKFGLHFVIKMALTTFITFESEKAFKVRLPTVQHGINTTSLKIVFRVLYDMLKYTITFNMLF